MWIPRWVKRLEEAIAKGSSEIQKTMAEQQRAARDASQTWEEKQTEVGATIAAAIKTASDAASNYEKPQRDKEHSLQWGMLWVTLFAAVAATGAAVGAFIYAHIAAGQLETMNRTYGEIKAQTSAAQCMAKTASQQTALFRQQLEQENAAIIRFDGSANENEINFSFTNLGHYAATDLTAVAVISIREIPTNRIIEKLPPLHYSVKNIPPAPMLTIEEGQDRNVRQWSQPYDPSLIKQQLERFGKVAVTTELSISYNNGFRLVKDGGCNGYTSFPPIQWKNPGSTGFSGDGGIEQVQSCDALPQVMVDRSRRYAENLQRKKQFESQQPK